ncbi:major facilitator superfamily domain-containing protein [Lipomyces kononenkoae]|uniref:Major facilitator superfamily domain-containing protein n=1 Tax=Lipomyces kononenkoae TaxID=34357 RepID=A0ACC3T7B4_LIPKO
MSHSLAALPPAIEQISQPLEPIPKDLEAAAPVTTRAAEAPYTVFTLSHKRAICAAATCAALFSPLATNIYFPSITIIASDLGTTVEMVNITVTTYMILQGIAPTIWGSFADVLGRRPVYLMTVAVFVLANLGLALQHSYVGLLVLRMCQSAGSSATVAIGAGTIADVAAQEERGSYIGLYSSGIMVAPAIAPVLGGVLSDTSYGWRASFWFLFAAGAALLLILFVWMPETGRNIVGNGSIPARGINMSLLEMLSRRRNHEEDPASTATKKQHKSANPLHLLTIIAQKDVAIVLLANGLIYTGFYCVTVGFSSQMATIYNLTTLKIGLCFLPYGAGCSIGSIVTGRLLDYEFRKFARKLGYGDGRAVRQTPDFPIERARMYLVWYLVAVTAADTLVFGWTFRANISIAVPLVLLFINGFSITGFFTFQQVLLVDLYPQESASVTAANNLVRCLLGAAGSAVVDNVISAIGMGWTYTIVTGMILLSIPLLITELRCGQKWRRARLDKLRSRSMEATAQAKLDDGKNDDSGEAELDSGGIETGIELDDKNVEDKEE